MWPSATLSLLSLCATSPKSNICSISSLLRSAIDIRFRRDIVDHLRGGLCLPGNQGNLVNPIGFFEHYINSFIFSRRDILAHDIRSNGELPGTAIYQYSDQDPLRPCQGAHKFHGCGNRAAAKDYIVPQHDGFIVYRNRNFKRDDGCRAYVMRSV